MLDRVPWRPNAWYREDTQDGHCASNFIVVVDVDNTENGALCVCERAKASSMRDGETTSYRVVVEDPVVVPTLHDLYSMCVSK